MRMDPEPRTEPRLAAGEDLPLVSIVISSYNYARYLPEAIDSVLAQDYPNVELIVLDDGSTDETRRVLEAYSLDLFYRETQENMGETRTLNKGWRMSRGSILAKLSADDVLLPGAVRSAVEHLRTNPDTVLTYCDFEVLDEDSNVIRRVTAPEVSYRDMVVRFVCPPGPGSFFRRKAFEAVGGWDERFRRLNDQEFYLRLGLRGRFRKIPEVLAGYRLHGGSQSFAEGDERAAQEFLHLISEYYATQEVPPEVMAGKREAFGNAHVQMARAHFVRRRYAKGLAEVAKALRSSPGNVLRPDKARVLLHGLFPRSWYGLFVRLVRAREFAKERLAGGRAASHPGTRR